MLPLEAYLTELRDIRSLGATVEETAYYPALATLLTEVGKKLKPKVRCVMGLQELGAGFPDGGLFTEEQFDREHTLKPLPGQVPSRGVRSVRQVIRVSLEMVRIMKSLSVLQRRVRQKYVQNASISLPAS